MDNLIITEKLKNFNLKNGKVIFDKKNNTYWLNQVAIGELYNIIQSRVSQILKELKEDEIYDISNTNIVKEGRSKTRFYDLELVKNIGIRTRSKVGIELQKYLVKLSEEYRKQDKLDVQYDPLTKLLMKRDYSKDLNNSFTELFAAMPDYEENKKNIKFIIANCINIFYQGITKGWVAADIKYRRCTHKKKNCGLQTFKGKRDGPTINDVQNAKNYLTIDELDALETYFKTSVNKARNTDNLNVRKLEMLINDVANFVSNDYWNGKSKDKITNKIADEYAKIELGVYRKQLPVGQATLEGEIYGNVSKF